MPSFSPPPAATWAEGDGETREGEGEKSVIDDDEERHQRLFAVESQFRRTGKAEGGEERSSPPEAACTAGPAPSQPEASAPQQGRRRNRSQ